MPYDSDATKTRIFEAATAEFAERGVSGARINHIAERARANKQLIYAYFGDKEQLFAAVLQERLEQLAEAIVIDPEHIPDYVGELFDFHVANPELVRLLLWEALHYGTDPVPNQPVRAEHYQEKAATIALSQAQGITDASLNPRYLMFVLLSLTGWWFAVPQLAKMLIGEDPEAPSTLAEYRSCIVEASRRLLVDREADREADRGG